MPRNIDIVDALPMTPTGKVEKYKLRERRPLTQRVRRAAPALAPNDTSTGAAR